MGGSFSLFTVFSVFLYCFYCVVLLWKWEEIYKGKKEGVYKRGDERQGGIYKKECQRELEGCKKGDLEEEKGEDI